jgi:hypothetical protein
MVFSSMQHANKNDIRVFLVCVYQATALIYTCCYCMLLRIHPNEHEYSTVAVYGFIQFSIGYFAGCSIVKCFHRPIPASSIEEEFPLLTINELNHPLSSADIEETLMA